jgi:hypothetical protein
MAGKKPNPFSWFSHGPLGPWGRKLGFRWIFPIGTMPVPFHPLVLPLVLAGLVAWTVHSALASAVHAVGSGWPGMLILAALLGLGMSVPILAWALMALGGRFIQAVLILCAMVLIAAQSLVGSGPVWLITIPAGFVGVWAVQMVQGRIVRRRLLAEWNAFEAPEIAHRPVALSQNFTWGTPADILNRHPFTEMWLIDRENPDIGRGNFRLDQAALAAVRNIAGETMPDGWSLKQHNTLWMLERAGPIPSHALRLSSAAWKVPLRALAPGLLIVTVDDGDPKTVICGQVQTIAPVPLFEVFHWTAIFGGQSLWRVGFAYGRGTRIGTLDNCFAGIVTLPETPLPLPAARLAELLEHLAAAVARRQIAVAAFKTAIVADPMGFSSHSNTLRLLQAHGPASLGPEAGTFLLDWLNRARDARKRHAVSLAAGLIAKLPDDAFAAIADQLFKTLNSRMLGLQWKLVPGFDPAPLPKDTPRFGDSGGFGLIFTQSALYVRLGDVHPPARGLIAELAKEMTLPKPAMQAIDRWKANAEA